MYPISYKALENNVISRERPARIENNLEAKFILIIFILEQIRKGNLAHLSFFKIFRLYWNGINSHLSSMKIPWAYNTNRGLRAEDWGQKSQDGSHSDLIEAPRVLCTCVSFVFFRCVECFYVHSVYFLCLWEWT